MKAIHAQRHIRMKRYVQAILSISIAGLSFTPSEKID